MEKSITPREQIRNKAIDFSYEEDNFLEWEDCIGDYNDDKDYIEKAFTTGAEYGYNLAIKNVCGWLMNNLENVEDEVTNEPCITNYECDNKEQFIDDIKQAMKL